MKLLRKIVSFILSIVFTVSIITVMPNNVKTVSASTNYTQTDIESKLKDLMNTYVDTNWTDYYYGSECKGFANLMFYKLFDVTYIGAYNSTKYYIPNPSGATAVGILDFDHMSKSAAKTLLSKGMPGDFIQVRRRDKSWGHSMILVSTSSTGVTLFDCNSSSNYCLVRKYSVTWDDFYSKNSAMSLYRADNYVSKPATPTIKSCTADSTSITINWGSVSGATAYEVDGHIQGVTDYSNYTTNCTSTSYTVSGLKSGTKYYFRVRAKNSSGTSGNSTPYAVYTKPTAPTNVSISQDSDSQLTLTWKAVSGASKYRVEYCIAKDSSRDFVVKYSTLTSNTFTHVGLDSGTKYCYRVTAILEGEQGLEGSRTNDTIYSDCSDVAVKFTKISKPETGLDSSGNVTIKWDKVVGDSSYKYEIHRRAYDAEDKTWATVSSTSYTDEKAGSGYIYKYRIYAIKSDSSGSKVTSCDSFYAGSKITSGVTLTPASATSMKISWTKPKSAISLKYGVYRKSGSTYKLIKTTTDTSYTDSGLTAGNTYQYYVQVLDSSGNYLTEYADNSAKLEILPTGVSLSKSEAVITAGDNLSLTATVSPSSCTDTSVSWSSSNESVATVSSSGVITAVAEGTAVITVTTSNSKTAKCNITVQSAECSHNYVTTRTEATCEEDGILESVCSLCGDTVVEVIPATGHSYSDEWTIIKEATCAEEGEQAHICTVCGAETDNTSIDMTDHSFGEWITETEATCSESGSNYRVCSVCGITETEHIDALDHSYTLTNDEAPTLDGPGTKTYTCDNCGDSYYESYTLEIDEGILQIGSYAPTPGETFTVPVTITDSPGLAGFDLAVNYDNTVLTPVSVDAGDLISDLGYFTSILDDPDTSSEDLSNVTASWVDIENMTEDGTLFTITFEVSSDAADGEYIIYLTYDSGDLTNETSDTLTNVMPELQYGTITVAESVIRGDINLDRSVTLSDAITLLRYLVGWNITLSESQMEAADVYYDGKVNKLDNVRLLQIVAGYNVTSSNASTVSLLSTNSMYSATLLSSEDDANEGLQIEIGDVEAVAGEYIYVPVTIENNPGIVALSLSLNFDSSYLTPISIEKGDILQNGYFASNIEDEENIDIENITVVWNDSGNMTENGTLFTLVFSISDAAETGQSLSVEIDSNESSISSVDSQTFEFNDVEFTAVQGTIDVVDVVDDETDEDYVMNVYYINNVSIVSDIGDYMESISASGEFYLQTEIACTYAETVSAVIVIAEYDIDGRLINTVFEDVTDEMLDEGIYETYISQSDTDIDKIKVYIWDSLEGMQPLSDVTEIS